jgi:hypothetical protein
VILDEPTMGLSLTETKKTLDFRPNIVRRPASLAVFIDTDPPVSTSIYGYYFWPTTGDGFLLNTIASVFLGGTSVFGGTGSVVGTFVAAYIIGAINAGIVSAGINAFYTQLAFGFVIVISVVLQIVIERRIRRRPAAEGAPGRRGPSISQSRGSGVAHSTHVPHGRRYHVVWPGHLAWREHVAEPRNRCRVFLWPRRQRSRPLAEHVARPGPSDTPEPRARERQRAASPPSRSRGSADRARGLGAARRRPAEEGGGRLAGASSTPPLSSGEHAPRAVAGVGRDGDATASARICVEDRTDLRDGSPAP